MQNFSQLTLLFLLLLFPSLNTWALNDVRIMKNTAGHWSVLAATPEEVQKQVAALTQSFPADAPSNPPSVCCLPPPGSYCVAELHNVLPSHLLNILGKRATIDGPNCYNAALYAKKILPVIGHLPERGLTYTLEDSGLCHKVDGSPQPGDIALAKDVDLTFTHSFIYVSDKLIFQKADYSLDSPYELKGIESIQHFQDPSHFSLQYYRCQSMPAFLSSHPEVAREVQNVIDSWEELIQSTCPIPLIDFDPSVLAADVESITATMLGYHLEHIEKIKENSLGHYLTNKIDLIEDYYREFNDDPDPNKVMAAKLLNILAMTDGHTRNHIFNHLEDIVAEIVRRPAEIVAGSDGERNESSDADSGDDIDYMVSSSEIESYLAKDLVLSALKDEMQTHYRNRQSNLIKDNIYGAVESGDVPICKDKNNNLLFQQNLPLLLSLPVPPPLMTAFREMQTSFKLFQEKQKFQSAAFSLSSSGSSAGAAAGSGSSMELEKVSIEIKRLKKEIKGQFTNYCQALKKWVVEAEDLRDIGGTHADYAVDFIPASQRGIETCNKLQI